MKTNLTYVKVPEGLLKAGNEKGIINDVLFYYQLKAIHISGHFIKGKIIPQIKERLKYAESTIWIKIRRLIKIGLMKHCQNGYRLVKYDTLFDKLGYDLTPSQSEKKNRLGDFRITKIHIRHIESFKEICAFLDLKLNLQRQTFAVLKKHKKLIPKIQMAIKPQDGLKFFSNLFMKADISKHLDERREACEENEYMELSCGVIKIDQKANIDIALSCQSFAQLLGFSSASTGYTFQRKLVELGYIKTENRKHIYMHMCTLQEFQQMNLDPSYHYNNSTIFKQLPNKIIFTDRLL